jgi:hypothetical protein
MCIILDISAEPPGRVHTIGYTSSHRIINVIMFTISMHGLSISDGRKFRQLHDMMRGLLHWMPII